MEKQSQEYFIKGGGGTSDRILRSRLPLGITSVLLFLQHYSADFIGRHQISLYFPCRIFLVPVRFVIALASDKDHRCTPEILQQFLSGRRDTPTSRVAVPHTSFSRASLLSQEIPWAPPSSQWHRLSSLPRRRMRCSWRDRI